MSGSQKKVWSALLATRKLGKCLYATVSVLCTDTEKRKALLACFGKNCGDFLQYRVGTSCFLIVGKREDANDFSEGPAMALIAIGVTAWQLARAIQHGTTHDIVFASINLALAIVSAVVVFVGLFAKGAIAAACGPIGIGTLQYSQIYWAPTYKINSHHRNWSNRFCYRILHAR